LQLFSESARSFNAAATVGTRPEAGKYGISIWRSQRPIGVGADKAVRSTDRYSIFFFGAPAA
jgi:hypothetical protein